MSSEFAAFDARIPKLPKWAQAYIRRLERHNRELRQDLANASSGTSTTAFARHFNSDAISYDLVALNNDVVVFKVQGGLIDCRVIDTDEGSVLQVVAEAARLVIEPRMASTVLVHPESYL